MRYLSYSPTLICAMYLVGAGFIIYDPNVGLPLLILFLPGIIYPIVFGTFIVTGAVRTLRIDEVYGFFGTWLISSFFIIILIFGINKALVMIFGRLRKPKQELIE